MFFYILIFTIIMLVDSQNINSSSGYIDYISREEIYGEKNNHILKDFSSHIFINPKISHGRTGNVLSSTLDQELENSSHLLYIVLSYKYNGKNVISDLYLEENIIPNGHFLIIQRPNQGQDFIKNFTKTDLDLCHYQGKLRDSPNSKVAISTCNDGIKGVVFDGFDTYIIHSVQNGSLHDDHFLLKQENYLKNGTCGSKKDTNFRVKRSMTNDEIQGPYNGNKYSSFVETLFVVDRKMSQAFKGNIKNIHKNCQEIANIVNSLFAPLNIFIALVGVVVWNESNEIYFSSDSKITLQNFLKYRKSKSHEYPNDFALLLTKESFDQDTIGKAFVDTICTKDSGGLAVHHSPIAALVAATVAHELGHVFGMNHDDDSYCNCLDKMCIMCSTLTEVIPTHWSTCSINELISYTLSTGKNECLRNKPTKLAISPQCGNGFVEPGEQCDCGYAKNCRNNCCDPYTCMLYKNASCGTGKCCDLSTCSRKLAGSECRAAENECDLPEYCTGESEYCPTDVFKRDTEPCDEGSSFCYEGDCRSHNKQCKVLWGQTGKSLAECYDSNIKGNRTGNCGFDYRRNVFRKCNKNDIMCGKLHCRTLNENLEFGINAGAEITKYYVQYSDRAISCKSVKLNLGLDTDQGLTPNGAKCGDNKMCVQQKCLAIEELNAQGIGVPCRENCSGNGICNNRGHCHCFDGLGGEVCNDVGNGGSVDSGPASNPNRLKTFTIALFIFFLGVVPSIAIILLFWNRKYFIQLLQKKESDSSKAPDNKLKFIINSSATMSSIDRTVKNKC